MPTRAEIMRAGLDFATSRGVEIGPLADPLVRKSEGHVTYVDYTDADKLRAKYANRPELNAANIVDVDAIWGENTLADCLGSGQTVDYVLASHVAEHVPDLITWLEEVRLVLRPGGQLRLVLPDKRFSADALRDETRITDLLTAWLLRARRPGVHQVLDFRLHHAPSVDGWGIFNGTSNLAAARPLHSFEVAMEAARWARDLDEYLDVHCTVVKPLTFARLMQRLAGFGVLRMACVTMIDSAMPLMEFYVFMEPCDDRDVAAASWQRIQARLHDPLPGSAAARAAEGRAAEVVRLQAELTKARERIAVLERQVSRLGSA